MIIICNFFCMKAFSNNHIEIEIIYNVLVIENGKVLIIIMIVKFLKKDEKEFKRFFWKCEKNVLKIETCFDNITIINWVLRKSFKYLKKLYSSIGNVNL